MNEGAKLSGEAQVCMIQNPEMIESEPIKLTLNNCFEEGMCYNITSEGGATIAANAEVEVIQQHQQTLHILGVPNPEDNQERCYSGEASECPCSP